MLIDLHQTQNHSFSRLTTNKKMNLFYECFTENVVEAAGMVTNKTGHARIT